MRALAHNFLTENVPCESHRMLIDGNIMIKIKISFLFAFLGLVLVKVAIVLQASEMSWTNYIKCLPLLVVQPCLSAQLLSSILRFKMKAQCELFYVITIKFHMHATVGNRTMRLHGLDVPFTISPTIISFTCAVWDNVHHLD